MKLKISDNVKKAVSLAGDSVNKNNKKYSDKAVKPVDHTYTGRITEIETLDDGSEKYKVIFDNKIKYVPLNEGVHYKNEIVRVYVPNGNLTKAYGESIESKPASRIIVSANQMVFESDVDVESFTTDDSGELVANVTSVTINKVIDLTRDSNGRPTKAIFPDKSEVSITYKD